MTPTTPTTTPLHAKVWVASRLDDARGKVYRAECACGINNDWLDDSARALADARAHRSISSPSAAGSRVS